MAFSFGDSSPRYDNDYDDRDYDDRDYDDRNYDDRDHDYLDEYEDDDPFMDCKICEEPVLLSRMDKHLENRHKCVYCNDCSFMNMESLKVHIQEKHMVSCKHCNAKKLTDEIAQHELTHSVVGMIQLQQLTDERFNQLVAENRIYAKEGCLYIRESDRLQIISQNLMRWNLDESRK